MSLALLLACGPQLPASILVQDLPAAEATVRAKGATLPFIHRDTRVYLRDLLDHVLRNIDLAESYRDQVTGLMEGYLTAVSFRTNEVVGVLTLVGTIFLPLSFLTYFRRRGWFRPTDLAAGEDAG